MLGEIFYWVFNMSIAASVCGLAVLLIRQIRRIPRRVSVWLWLIPFIRMCIPVGITGKYGLMSLISRFTTKTVTIYPITDDMAFTMMNSVMGANSYFPITYKVDLLEEVFKVGGWVWLTVSIALILTCAVIYAVTMREIRNAVHLKDNVYLSDKIRVPAVYGIARPRIVLPCGYEEKDLTYVLLHERTHIHRRDNLWRTMAFFLVCLHWFNPLSWLFLKLLYTDMELACDEAVLARCDETERKAYAHALVSTVEKTNVFASAFGGARIRLRIESILSYKKMTAVSLVSFTALLAVIAYILLTNAA